MKKTEGLNKPKEREYFVRYMWGEEKIKDYYDQEEVEQLLTLLKHDRIYSVYISKRKPWKTKKKEQNASSGQG